MLRVAERKDITKPSVDEMVGERAAAETEMVGAEWSEERQSRVA